MRRIWLCLIGLALVGCSNATGSPPGEAVSPEAPGVSAQSDADPVAPQQAAPKPAPEEPKSQRPDFACSPQPVIALPPVAETAAGGARFRLNQERSCLAYAVRETFVGRPLPFVAVGSTSSFAGHLLLGDDGRFLPTSLTFDATTFISDDQNRDSKVDLFLTTPESGPYASFDLTSGGLGESMELTGTLTLRGVSQPVTLNGQAHLDGDTLMLEAITKVLMSDFGIPELNFIGFLKAEDIAYLHVKVIAVRAQ